MDPIYIYIYSDCHQYHSNLIGDISVDQKPTFSEMDSGLDEWMSGYVDGIGWVL